MLLDDRYDDDCFYFEFTEKYKEFTEKIDEASKSFFQSYLDRKGVAPVKKWENEKQLLDAIENHTRYVKAAREAGFPEDMLERNEAALAAAWDDMANKRWMNEFERKRHQKFKAAARVYESSKEYKAERLEIEDLFEKAQKFFDSVKNDIQDYKPELYRE